MAILWQKKVQDTHYEVRTAGDTRRLYTNGVFHSQFNPRQPVTGGVWDCLMLPAFFYPPRCIKRILVLGVGGGAVIKQLLHFIQPGEVVGVELDRVHLDIARRFFGVKGENVSLQQAEAVQWLSSYRGPLFDMIIEDLFSEQEGEPVRAVMANTDWFKTLLKKLTPNGVLVANFVSSRELRKSAYFVDKQIRSRFHSAYQFTTPFNENVVGAFLRQASSSRILRDNLIATPLLNPNLKTSRLRYTVRQLAMV